MTYRLPPSQSLFVVALLLSFGGVVSIVGPLLFAAWLAVLPACLLLGTALLLAGVGLIRARLWGWYLALGIAVTGLAVVLWRLLDNGAAEWPLLSGALVTDVIVAILLLRERPEQTQGRRAGL
jgi:hypothetical protein